MNSRDLTINITIALISLLLGFAGSYFFYMKGTIDNLNGDLKYAREEFNLCKQEKKRIKEDGQELQVLVKKAEIETEFKLKEIQILNNTIRDKDKKIAELNTEIDKKEKKIENMLLELREIITEGATEEMREKLSTLYAEIEQLNKQNASLKDEKKKLQEELKEVKLKLLEKEKEIEIFKSVEIPNMKDKVNTLESKLQLAKSFEDFLNVRAEIENISIDNRNNILQFDLVFDSEEIAYLSNHPKLSKFTFSPKVTNKTDKAVFIPQINDFGEFTKQKHELTEFITINFPVSNYEFRRYKNGTKGVNLTKGDEIKIKVILDELYEMEIANKTFRLK